MTIQISNHRTSRSCHERLVLLVAQANNIQSFRCKALPLLPRQRPQRSISRTFYANHDVRWKRWRFHCHGIDLLLLDSGGGLYSPPSPCLGAGRAGTLTKARPDWAGMDGLGTPDSTPSQSAIGTRRLPQPGRHSRSIQEQWLVMVEFF